MNDEKNYNSLIMPTLLRDTGKHRLSEEASKGKHVGIWIRVSTEDQARGDSPEHHQKRAESYAISRDWDVKEIYHLEAVSGKSVIFHSEAKRMLNDIKSGHITGLIFSKVARLARNTRELLEFSDFFQQHNADLISLQEAIDTSTPAGRFFYTMIAGMAEWEREEIASRVRASVPIRAKLGKPLGGSAPFGYCFDEHRKLVPDSKEAPVRKLIYEMFLEHRRKKTVARLLSDAGHRTRKGAKFTDTTIERLIRDPIAKGERRVNYTKSLGAGKKWVLKPKEDWVITKVEPVISEELWEQCNMILDESRKNRKPPSRKAVHLFTGVAFCACDTKMYVPSNSPKYICYTCRNKISVDDLNGVFHEQLKTYFCSSTEITGYMESADHAIKEKETLVTNLSKELSKVKRGIDTVYNLLFEDKISKDGFVIKYQPLEDRRLQLEEQIPELQGEIDFLKIRYLSSDQIFTEAKDLYTRWPTLVLEEKRKVVENLVEKIIVSSDEVTINLCYLPSSSEYMAGRQHNFRGSSRQRA